MRRKTTNPEYVVFEHKYCTGCGQCLRSCPTKAIRLRKNTSIHLVDQCIGCGECVRVCPEGAVSTRAMDTLGLNPGEISVAICSPVLYSQFPGVMPNDVLLGLKRMGFDHAIDLSYYLEMFQLATEEFIMRNRETGEAPWPLISPICPVVIRLIAYQFPSLLDHILPIKRPAALVNHAVKERFAREHNVAPDAVILHHITPCPIKIVYSGSLMRKELKLIDKTLGFTDIYPELKKHTEQIVKEGLSVSSIDRINSFSNARGPMWGMSGGEVAGMKMQKVLAVSGLKETITYLGKIEMGLFRDMEYIELRTCPEGCLGGPLTAVDRYIAKSAVQKMIKSYGAGRRLARHKIVKLYDSGWFFSERSPQELAQIFGIQRSSLSISQMQEVENLAQDLQKRFCMSCGAPDCRTFAEDVVRGIISIDACSGLKAGRSTGVTEKEEPK